MEDRGYGGEEEMHGTFTVGADVVIVEEDVMVEVGEGAAARFR